MKSMGWFCPFVVFSPTVSDPLFDRWGAGRTAAGERGPRPPPAAPGSPALLDPFAPVTLEVRDELVPDVQPHPLPPLTIPDLEAHGLRLRQELFRAHAEGGGGVMLAVEHARLHAHEDDVLDRLDALRLPAPADVHRLQQVFDQEPVRLLRVLGFFVVRQLPIWLGSG